MTKTYEDGIKEAIEIVDKWSCVGIVKPAVDTILFQLQYLLPTTENIKPPKKTIRNKLICLILGHREIVGEAYPYTIYTYTECNRCADLISLKETPEKL